MKFRVRLKAIHEATGLTQYAVAKQSGVSINTVVRYTENDEILLDRFEPIVVKLLKFYGLNWRDPDVIEIVNEKGDVEPETISPSGYSIAMPA